MSDHSKSSSAIVPTLNSTTGDDLHAAEALERVRPQLVTMPQEQLLPINLDILFAVSVILGALTDLAQYAAAIAGLPGYGRKILEHLADAALAALQAHTLFLVATAPVDDVGGLADNALKTRESLAVAADALADRGLLERAAIANMRAGKSYRDIGGNVISLANLFGLNWHRIKNKTAVDLSELRAAQTLGQQLIHAVGARSHGPTQIADASLLRQRAFTHMVNSYDQVRRAITFLRWNEKDADRIAPSLYSKSTVPARKDGTSTDPGPSSPTTPDAPPTNAPHAAGIRGPEDVYDPNHLIGR